MSDLVENKTKNHESFDDELNLSWLKEEQKMSQIHQNYLRENMQNIQIHTIYINANNHIDKIVCFNQELTVLGSSSPSTLVGLSSEMVLQIVQSNRSLSTGTKYKLIDILVYNVDIEPENIQNFSNIAMNASNIDAYSPFLKSYPLVCEIKVPPSIFIFHDLNAIYFLFQEIQLINAPNHKSILKSENNLSTIPRKKTKKVSIQLPLHNKSKKYNKII